MRFPIQSWWLPAALLGLTPTGPAWAQLGLEEGPLIRFEKREHFFGDVPQNDDVSVVFAFANGGTDTLRIENVESSCGCTAVAPRDRTIPPGGSSGIEVIFHSRDYKGEKSQVVAIYSNDPAEPRVDLAVHANVIPFVQIADEWLEFGEVATGSAKVVGTLVSAEAGTDFEIVGFEGEQNWVDWDIVAASAPNRTAYRVEARLRPDAPLGPFSERLIMKVKHPDRTEERIGIRGHVYSCFLLDKPEINFFSVKKGKTVTGSLEIRFAPDRCATIESVEIHAPHLRGELVPTASGYRLDVTFDSSLIDTDEARFRLRDFATLRTTDPRQPEILLELTGVVKQ